jgi:hypothetical protein
MKTVRNVARRAGLPSRNPPQPERDAAILARYVAGDPVAAIAAEHGVRPSRVRLVADRPSRRGWIDQRPGTPRFAVPDARRRGRPLRLLRLRWLSGPAADGPEPLESGSGTTVQAPTGGGGTGVLEANRRSTRPARRGATQERDAGAEPGSLSGACGVAWAARRRWLCCDLPRRPGCASQILRHPATDGAMRDVLATGTSIRLLTTGRDPALQGPVAVRAAGNEGSKGGCAPARRNLDLPGSQASAFDGDSELGAG